MEIVRLLPLASLVKGMRMLTKVRLDVETYCRRMRSHELVIHHLWVELLLRGPTFTVHGTLSLLQGLILRLKHLTLVL